MEEPMKRRYLTVVISAVLFLLALGLTLYPVISNYVNQKYASTIQTAYQEILNQTDDSEIRKIKELAHTYNKVLPHDTSLLGITPGEDLCTLVTCYPTGVNTHRLLVRGTRIPYEEAEAVQIEQAAVEEPTSKWESQYLLGLGIGALAVLAGGSVFLTVWILRRYHQKSNRKKVGRYVKK